VIAALVVLALHVSAASSALEKCRALDKEFDTKNMPKPCQAAADDTTLTIAERVEALRRLAFAHILNGDEALAEPAFMKMLVFSPSTELPADAGPKFRDIYNQVKKRFDSEGALTVTFTPPLAPTKPDEPVALQIDLGDRLNRVVGAKVRAASTTTGAPENGVSLDDKLVRNELGPGQLRFTGAVPEPKTPINPAGRSVEYSVVFEGWDGQPVAPPTPIKGSYVRPGSGIAQSTTTTTTPAGEEAPPWTLIGIGGAGGLVLIGGAVGGIWWCYAEGPCRTQDAWVRVQIHQGGGA
jgi:hypothetical protein